MQTTSHFVGAVVPGERFVNLFVELQGYLRSHDLENAIILQNILSLHITLYYLNERLSENEKAQILIDTASLTLRRNAIPELASGYFGEPGKARVCYLGCPSNDKLEEINQFFAAKYDYSQIPENQLKFVPHISLFRISDPDAYEPHKDAVDALMNKELTAISCDSLVQGVYLFRVNSLFHPEIQIPIR